MIWGFPQKFSGRPGLGEMEGCMVRKSGCTPARLCVPGSCWKFRMYPSSAMCSGFLLEIWNVIQLGDFGGVLVGNWYSDVLGPSDGGLVRR